MFCSSADQTCKICGQSASCSTATFAAGTANQVGTCSDGVCSYGNTCAVNSDCTTSMLCSKDTMTCASECVPASGSGDNAVVDSCTTAYFGMGT